MSRGGQMRSTKTIYVRGIPDRIRHDDLKRAFTKYGKVLDITIPVDYYSGLSKGFCFIEYDDIRDAEEAQYRMDRSRVFGREIDVEFSRGHRKTPGEMRNRDGGGSRRGSDRGGYGRGGRGSRSRSRSRTRSRTRSPPPSRHESSSRHHRERRRSRSRSNGPNGHHHHHERSGPPASNGGGDRGSRYRSKSHSVSPRPVRNNSRGRSRSISRRSDKINPSRSRTRSPSQ